MVDWIEMMRCFAQGAIGLLTLLTDDEKEERKKREEKKEEREKKGASEGSDNSLVPSTFFFSAMMNLGQEINCWPMVGWIGRVWRASATLTSAA